MSKPLEWYDDNANNPAWIKALAEVRRLKDEIKRSKHSEEINNATFPH
jgi:hypothetical protein